MNSNNYFKFINDSKLIISENSRDRLMRLRQDAKNIPDEDISPFGIRYNDKDVLISDLNNKLGDRFATDKA